MPTTISGSESTGAPGVQPEISAAVQAHLREGRLPCADAFEIAHEHGTAPGRIAALADAMGIRIGWCQLGLFESTRKHETGKGVEKGEGEQRNTLEEGQVPPELCAQILGTLEEDRLPCAQAWGIAKRLGLTRIEVGRAADAMGVRISRCQLGCFP